VYEIETGMNMKILSLLPALSVVFLFVTVLVSSCAVNTNHSNWMLIDDFENTELIGWQIADTQNDTKPFVPSPQVTEIRTEQDNRYLIKNRRLMA
jgi:hypothetical protein